MRSKKTLARGEALLYFTNSVTTASLDFEQSSSIQTWNSSSRLALDNTNLIKFISLSVQIIPTTLIHEFGEHITSPLCIQKVNVNFIMLRRYIIDLQQR